MPYNTAVQLRDGSDRLVLGQYFDPAQDKFVLGNAALMGITSLAVPALGDSLLFKSSPCNVFGMQVCTGAVAGWLLLIDTDTIPANGAVAPKRAWQVGINTTLEIGFAQPVRLTTGAVLAFSTTGPFTLTKSATAFLAGEVT